MKLAPLKRKLTGLRRKLRQARMVAKAIQSRCHPIVAHIIPIRRCNLSCAYCNEYDSFSQPVPVAEMGTMKKRFRRGLTAIAEWGQENRHLPVDEQQKTLNAKLRGHYQYYGRPTNYRSIWRFFREVQHTWRKWLSRRTRGQGVTWEKYAAILRKHPLLRPRIVHPWRSAGSHA